MSSNPTDAEVFVYTGTGGAAVPRDVVRIWVDPSVTSIPAGAFEGRKKLAEVELCEGLVEIGGSSFGDCLHSITKINIPNSLRRIKDYAFAGSLRYPIRLHNGIESIGRIAFAGCIFTNFRVPLLITVIPERMLYWCKSMFSLEIPENVTEIKDCAFMDCFCLRNVAFPPNAVFDDRIFSGRSATGQYDLQLLFGSDLEIIRELVHRFEELPIHSIVYYQSYNQGVLQDLISAINMRSGQSRTLRSKLDPTGNQQDCLGMTPLHILACSSVHSIEVYRVIVENYPTNLITEDRWGALPLLYVFWGAAPTEIIQFLLDRYQSLYPNHVFNWTNMVWTMGRCDTPEENIQNLLHVKQMHFPEQPIDWDLLLDEFVKPLCFFFNGAPFQEQMQFIFKCGLSTRVEALAFQVWRDHITNMIHTAAFDCNEDNRSILREIQDKLAHFDGELHRLKEMTSILELALWKMNINDNILAENTTRHQKKMKKDESSIRQQCRVTCGADVVIGHVLQFLVTV
jgi:hypothetical protein